MPKPYTLQVQEVVMHSALPKEHRHLLHVMALLANNETGASIIGQRKIAERMGATDRHVRRLLADLDDPKFPSPVRVQRQARFRGEGRGRTSDEWRLVLVPVDSTNRNTVPVSPSTKRNGVPVSAVTEASQNVTQLDGLTGTPRRTNRTSTHDQPEHCSGDLSATRSFKRSAAVRARPRDPNQPRIHFLLSLISEHLAKTAANGGATQWDARLWSPYLGAVAEVIVRTTGDHTLKAYAVAGWCWLSPEGSAAQQDAEDAQQHVTSALRWWAKTEGWNAQWYRDAFRTVGDMTGPRPSPAPEPEGGLNQADQQPKRPTNPLRCDVSPEETAKSPANGQRNGQ